MAVPGLPLFRETLGAFKGGIIIPRSVMKGGDQDRKRYRDGYGSDKGTKGRWRLLAETQNRSQHHPCNLNLITDFQNRGRELTQSISHSTTSVVRVNTRSLEKTKGTDAMTAYLSSHHAYPWWLGESCSCRQK